MRVGQGRRLACRLSTILRARSNDAWWLTATLLWQPLCGCISKECLRHKQALCEPTETDQRHVTRYT